jgi:DNA mismatch repair protein MutS
LFEYISQNQKVELDHLKSISYMNFDWFLELDESTIKNLDLLYNFSTNSHSIGTLFWVLDNTKTSMWKRLLRENIVKPSRDIAYIKNRHDMIEQFLSNPILLDSITQKLKYVSDLDAIMTRLSLWRSGPRDLLNLKRSLQSVLEVQEIITSSWNKKLINMFNL